MRLVRMAPAGLALLASSGIAASAGATRAVSARGVGHAVAQVHTILQAHPGGQANTGAVARAAVARCRLHESDAQARGLARTAQVTAEAIATEHHGEYTHVTPASLQATEPDIPLSRRQAVSYGLTAYLLSASADSDGYALTTRAFDGNTYSVRRTAAGQLVRTARECGRQVRW